MAKTNLYYKTVILSDIHLGAPDCKINEVNHFLKHVECETLILNGDIIDGWSLNRRGGWDERHTRFIRLLLKKAEKKRTDIIYIRGNHDDILSKFIPLVFDKVHFVEEYIHRSNGNDYLCLHGDIFDAVTQNFKFLALMGDIGYQWLLRLNRAYNGYRSIRGKPHFSLSKKIKAKVKGAVNYVSHFEEEISGLAEKRDCYGVICGHIHTPEDKMIDEVHYLNSGDWVESLTAIVEDENENMGIITYREFEEKLKHKTDSLFTVSEEVTKESTLKSVVTA